MKEVESLFNPKSIAIIGASNTPGKVGNTLMLKLWKYPGATIPVNPSHDRVLGKKCYSSVSKYKEPIDLAIIAIPSKLVNKALIECGKKKIKNVIIISADFAETGNINLEKQIIQTAKKYKINFLGPNCFGIANPHLNLDTTFARSTSKKGSTTFAGQSGALWSYLSDLDLKFSKFISLGNMSGLDFVEVIEYLNKDKNTKRIVLYIESLGLRGKEFIEVCQKSKKPITVIKSGKSEQGNKAAISHTASLASEFKIYQGAFKQAKVKQVPSLSKALNIKSDFPSLLKEINKTKNPKVSIITNAGGAGILLTDLLESNKIDTSGKPLDLIGTAKAKDYSSALNQTKKKNSNTILVVLTPQSMTEIEKTAKTIIEFKKQNKNKKIIACFLGSKTIRHAARLLKKNKIPCFNRCI